MSVNHWSRSDAPSSCSSATAYPAASRSYASSSGSSSSDTGTGSGRPISRARALVSHCTVWPKRWRMRKRRSDGSVSSSMSICEPSRSPRNGFGTSRMCTGMWYFAARYSSARSARAARRPESIGMRAIYNTRRMPESEPQKTPYAKLAFTNPYNLSLFLGGLAVSALALNPIAALVVLGAEGLWMLHAPESRSLRKLLWDPRFEAIRRELEQRARQERMLAMEPAEQRRVQALIARQEEIDRLAAQNPSFTGDLLRSELQKTRKLVDAFLDMARTV